MARTSSPLTAGISTGKKAGTVENKKLISAARDESCAGYYRLGGRRFVSEGKRQWVKNTEETNDEEASVTSPTSLSGEISEV